MAERKVGDLREQPPAVCRADGKEKLEILAVAKRVIEWRHSVIHSAGIVADGDGVGPHDGAAAAFGAEFVQIGG